jgi:hypothetical protein
MLSRSPTERPRDAGVVLAALLELEPTLPRSSAGPSRVRIRRPPRARWVTAGVVIGLLVAALVTVPVGIGLARRGGASGAPAGRIVLASTSTPAKCDWKLVLYTDFDTDKAKLAWRNGDFHGQELRKVDATPVWHQGADWNQLWVSLGDANPDVFAVEAQFFAPTEPEVVKAAGLSVFADPVGPMHWSSSASIHGVSVSVGEWPGQGAQIGMSTPSGQNYPTTDYKGPLASPVSGKWRRLRIEGSRSGGWLRASLDGQLLLTEVGPRDLTGRHVSLDSGGASYHPSGVMWKHLRVLEGTEECR